MMSPPTKVIVTAPNWIGDAVMSLPLIGMLSAKNDIRLCVMAPRYTARVYWGIEAIDELIVFSNAGVMRGLGARMRLIRRLGASASLILPPSFSSALSSFLARIPNRIGFRTDGRRFLLTASESSRCLKEEHLSESYLRLGRVMLGRLGIEGDGHVSVPKLQVFEDDRTSIDRKLESRGAPSKGFCVVVPGATFGSAKAWPEPLYREAVRRLARMIPVVLAGGAAEKDLCSRVSSGIDGAFNLSGETSLGEFFALVERADVLVANDSGSPHVAGSIGTPSVVIFGSTSPKWTSPLGECVTILREPTLCSPCFLRECPIQLECFRRVDVERVVDHVARIVKNGSISP